MQAFIRRSTRIAACASLSIFLASCGGGGAGSPSVSSDPGAPVPVVLADYQAATLVIGQRDFQSYEPVPLPKEDTLYAPRSLEVAPDGRLFVVDSHTRILAFDSVPTVNGAAASAVLGPVEFQGPIEPGPNDLPYFPVDIGFHGNRMAIVDSFRSEVRIYVDLPSAENGPAVHVGLGGACSAAGMQHPGSAVLTRNGKLVVADSAQHRVLIWNQIPTTHYAEASVVLGQPNATTCMENSDALASGASARTLFGPTGLWSDGHRLAVVDSLNNRVLIWNSFPTTNHQAADIVLGQVNFEGVGENGSDGTTDAVPTASTLNGPRGAKAVDFNGYQFAVADTYNNRVLVWNGFPVSNGQAADVVLGQEDAQKNAENDTNSDGTPDGRNGRTFFRPVGVKFWGSKLLVTDQANNRVLVFESQ
jgi:hypothetical protein